MENIKDIVDKLVVDGNITIPKKSLEKNVYIMYKYFIEKEPEGEFIKEYLKKVGTTFDLIKASKMYIKSLIKQEVDIEEDLGSDTVTLKIIIGESN